MYKGTCKGENMAKKVTVSIPDMLHEKMEKWRESFNLSKMFQDAVTEAIQKKEDFQKRIREDLDLSQIVERLRNEKMQSEGNFYEAGKHDGVGWAKSAHYDDLIYALGWEDYENAIGDEQLGHYFLERQSHNRMMAMSPEGSNEYFKAYLKGWKKGVEQFWIEIRDKL
jgi:Arc/MetJ-type ribon-helix-helix transcriptional regulator